MKIKYVRYLVYKGCERNVCVCVYFYNSICFSFLLVGVGAGGRMACLCNCASEVIVTGERELIPCCKGVQCYTQVRRTSEAAESKVCP